MRWKAGYLQAVSPSSHAVNQVLELGLDEMENEEQKRLTNYVAWKNGRMEDLDIGQTCMRGAVALETTEKLVPVSQ